MVTDEQKGGYILVMDDDAFIRDLSVEMLGFLGYRVKTCIDGKEAVDLYKAAKVEGNPFSSVIMDLTIPGGMGGKEAAQLILAFDPAARLIVSSGYSTDAVMDDYESHGFCAAVVKPYNVEELAKVL